MISLYDLRTAWHIKLTELSDNKLTTLKPDEVFDPATTQNDMAIRRGAVLLSGPETVAFGNGVYSREEGTYQISIWVPRRISSALKRMDNLADAHVAHFFPANGRGLTVTRNTTSAHVIRRPEIRNMQRDGSYISTIIDVEFYTEHFPSS